MSRPPLGIPFRSEAGSFRSQAGRGRLTPPRNGEQGSAGVRRCRGRGEGRVLTRAGASLHGSLRASDSCWGECSEAVDSRFRPRGLLRFAGVRGGPLPPRSAGVGSRGGLGGADAGSGGTNGFFQSEGGGRKGEAEGVALAPRATIDRSTNEGFGITENETSERHTARRSPGAWRGEGNLR